LDFIRQYQYSCQWDYECVFFKASHDIRNIKIVGGDRFPNDPNEYIDFDNDGIGGNSDPDNDNDGTHNELDAFPYNPNAKADTDGDGFANRFDVDIDGDDIPYYAFKIDNSDPDRGWFGLNISPDNFEVFYNAALEAGCGVYDLDCYGPDLARALDVITENPLVITNNTGGVLKWGGGKEFYSDEDADNDGYIDNTTFPYSPDPETDAFPLDPTAWADVDLDCVPDNIDNDLNSIPDTDCDGLNNSIDTDDDNDSIPDSLIVPVIVEGLLDSQWSASSHIIDKTGLNLCAIEDVESNPNGSCNQLEVSYLPENNNNASGVLELKLQEKSVLNHANIRRGIEFKTYDYLNIVTESWGDRFYQTGYLEVEIKLTGATGDERVGFNLISSDENLSQTLPNDLKTYWPKVYSGEWTSLKIPLYEFFADMHHVEQIRSYLVVTDLDKISGLRVSSNLGDSAYSINIKNIQFVNEDQFPLQAAQCCWGNELSNNDFDNDGASGAYDEHPFVPNLDTDDDGITDGVDNDIDGDNIPNEQETEDGTDPYSADTDGDGVDDIYDFQPINPNVTGIVDISGTWRNRNAVNSMGMGPEEGDTSWWNINYFELGRRGCLFDDEYYFGPAGGISLTGTFSQWMGSETWLEAWMSPNGMETCGVPVVPWDGASFGSTYDYSLDMQGMQLTVYGLGAYIGMPRIQNGYYADQGGPSGSITYNISTDSTECILILDILSGNHEWWHFELEKIRDTNGEPMTPEKCDVSGEYVDWSLDSDSDGVPDYYDVFPQDPARTIDTDMDGIANVDDEDDDGDGVNDGSDCAPLDPSVSNCQDNCADYDESSGFDLTNATAVPVVIQDQFGGAFISESGSYSVPTGSESWAGFTVVPNTEVEVLPLTFGSGGQITFNANVEGNSNVDVRFRFEKAPPDGDDITPTFPSYTSIAKNLSTGFGSYTIDIPPQVSKTFSSIIFYIDTQNVALSLSDIVIKETPAAQGSEVGPLAFIYTFGGTQIPAENEFFMPTGNPDAGFAIEKRDTNPLYFGNGGYISFVGSVPDDGDVDVRFEVQFDAHPNTTPNYMTDVVTVSGAAEKNYSVSIPEQYDNSFKMVIAWLETFDTPVVMKEIMVGVTAQGAAKVGATEPALFIGPFEGAEYTAETNTYIFPSSAKSYAGFSNENTNLYPMTFDNGGCVTFNASAETDLRIRYKFERQPYPATLPQMVTDWVTISGNEQEYTVDVPPSATAGNTYSSLLLFIDENDRDLPVVITDVVATNTGACGVGLYNNNITDSSQNVGSSQDISQGRSFQLQQIGYGELDPNQDSDGDGVLNFYDRFPFDPNLTIDTDMDGIANELDSDDDGDGRSDSYDCAPLDKNVTNCILNCEFDSNNIDNNGLFSGVSVSENHQALDSSTASYLDFNIAKWLPNQSGEVQVPSQIEQIGYRAFNGLDITSVDIPDSVTIIQSMAFQNNSRLTEVDFGDAITKIGPYAFEQTAIKNVTLPDTVTQIGHYAFANSDIEQIYLGNSVEHIGDFAFAGAKISTLIIPSTVKSIGDNAFDYLDGNVFVIAPADQWVSSFHFPSTANFFTCLGLDINGNPEQCFSSYELVSNTVFDRPAALRYLNNGHITIPDTYHRIGERAFEDLQGILSSVTIPETITHIGDYAFKDLGLTTILLPDSIVSIGNGAFAGNQLSNISLPNNLINIGYAAFAGNNLGFIVLPANLEEVGAGAFINSSLNIVIFPEGLVRIEQNAFANNAITNINLPSSLHYIGDGAFENNQIITAVFKANGSIGQNAFANNPFITATVANGVTSPGGYDRQEPIITMYDIGSAWVVKTADNQIIYKEDDGSWPTNGTVIGYKQIHSQAEEYSDGGATASSYYFGEISVQTSGEIDTNIAGIQIVTYTATDPFGNSSFFERHIEVIDNTPPAITLNGSSLLVVESNANFEEPGATAFDKVDDQFVDIQTTIEHCNFIEENQCQSGQMVSAVDTDVSGTYLITYSATDSEGNVGTATREIIILPSFNDEVVVFRDGAIGTDWDKGIFAFDEELNWGAVNNSSDAPSIDWEIVADPERGDVIQVSHADNDKGAGILIETSIALNMLGAKDGGIVQFDIKIISGDPNITIKSGCGYPCGGGPQSIGPQPVGEWETVRWLVKDMLPGGNDGSTGLDLGSVTTGLEIWASGQRATVFQIDNISWKCVESCEGQEFVPTFTPWEKVDITNGYDAPTSYAGYNLLWSDEFNGTEVDTTKWGFDLGNGDFGWGNSELQYYRPENATVADGMLSIEAQYHSPLLTEVNGNPVPTGVRYTSSKLLTKNKFSFQYGRVDIRAVVAEGKGLWSAGWMLGDNFSMIGWPQAGEIDIVDSIGGPGQEDIIVNNMYWNPDGPSGTYGNYSPSANINMGPSKPGEVYIAEISDDENETFSNKFHVFSIIWTEDRIDFYVDDVLTTEVPLSGALKETFTQSPFYLILNVAVGGTWAGAPVFEDTIAPSQFPRGMLVDYVRVYQPSSNAPLYQGISNVTHFDQQASGARGINYSVYDNSIDTDGDGVADEVDAFKYNTLEWLDTDDDGIGNNADNDDDGDNYPDYRDDFPLDPSEWLDTDKDGVGNNSDTDDDDDAVSDNKDAFPLDAREWLDTDADGIGNNTDRDDDGDLTPDVFDLFPLSNRDWLDKDLDGIGDNSDTDSDGDGVINSLDAFPRNAMEWIDTDGAGVGDNADNDDDNDGVLDPDDAFPKDPNKWIYPDSDNDGYADNNDAFPLDSSEWLDTDGDGIGNNADNDDDGDGINDSLDPAPLDPTVPGGDNKQIISVMGNPVGVFGKSTLVEIGYNTSNNDSTTTGIGFRAHFNSTLMNISDVTYLFEKDLIVEVTGPLYDTENHDGSEATDQYYSVGWGSVGGDWPDENLPFRVLSLKVDIAQDNGQLDATSAPINFSYTALASGYESIAGNYNLDLISSTWDFDNSGHADALTDGLIVLRYGFDLHGDNLVRGVMHPGSTLTATEVETRIQNSLSMMDIDQNGGFDALTDGLILLRYLFDLKGENLIRDVVSPTGARTSSDAIIQHIERHMPSTFTE
jgi:beta-glucanase (GH16 family)